jgi:ubiquinone/menaquinone biosynthesis C-methylase UbiE
MNTTDFTEANREAWNETAPLHAVQNLESLLENFRVPGYSCLHKPLEVERLQALKLEGKAVAQLCCNNGRELISVKNLFKAGRSVGFDISDEFIEQAQTLNAAANQDVEFVRVNVLEIPDTFTAQFDLVYITIGALGWLPDLSVFLKTISRLLKPGGNVLIYEMHPMLDMFDGDENTKTNPLELKHSYFKTAPYIETGGLDYYGGSSYESKTMYWFHYKISDLIGGLIANGLQITAFEEFDFDISNTFAHFDALKIKPPMCYILEAQKRD